MMKRLNAIIPAVLLTALTGCTYVGLDWNSSLQGISLTWKGEQQVMYDPDTYQLGYNSSRNEYRVYDDRLAYWFTVRCSERPSEEGQNITADVSWTGESRTMEFKGISMTVEQTDENGMIWLWGAKERIGIVIQIK